LPKAAPERHEREISPLRVVRLFSVGSLQGPFDRVEQPIAFGGGCNSMSLELVGEANVGEEVIAVGVKVEKGA
jgi:hypothetical protein